VLLPLNGDESKKAGWRNNQRPPVIDRTTAVKEISCKK
jgi:hypothetical protein